MQSPFTLDHYVERDDERAVRLLLLEAVVAHALADDDCGVRKGTDGHTVKLLVRKASE